jgi:hypothetical protein
MAVRNRKWRMRRVFIFVGFTIISLISGFQLREVFSFLEWLFDYLTIRLS